MERHPRLTRPIHPLLRPDGSIQLGLDPGSALVATGVSAAECRWVTTLDGSRSEEQVLADAAQHGLTPERAGELVRAFAAQGVLDTEGVLEPLERRVVVVGAGSVPAHLVDVLREAGIGEVVRCVEDADPTSTDLAVITSTVPVPAGAGEPWRRARVPHLPVWCGPDHASVGPLVVPDDGPCLQCLELTRVHLDPAWPWIRAQISRPRVGPVVPVETHACVRSLVVGIAASVALDVLAHGPSASGWSLDACSPGPSFERRHWERHPACPRCASATSPAAGSQVQQSQWA